MKTSNRRRGKLLDAFVDASGLQSEISNLNPDP